MIKPYHVRSAFSKQSFNKYNILCSFINKLNYSLDYDTNCEVTIFIYINVNNLVCNMKNVLLDIN